MQRFQLQKMDITLLADNEFQLKQMLDILNLKLTNTTNIECDLFRYKRTANCVEPGETNDYCETRD